MNIYPFIEVEKVASRNAARACWSAVTTTPHCTPPSIT